MMKQNLIALILAASMAFLPPAQAFAANSSLPIYRTAEADDTLSFSPADDFSEENDDVLFEDEDAADDFAEDNLTDNDFTDETAETVSLPDLSDSRESESETEIELETEQESLTDDDDVIFLEGTSVNPLYADVITEADLLVTDAASEDDLLFEAAYTTDEAAIAANLKNTLLNRVTETTIYYSGSVDWNQSALTAKIDDWLYRRACVHNGVPNEGDYLKWSLIGYSWKASRSAQKVDGNYQYTYQLTFTYAANTAEENETTFEISRVLNSFGFNSSMSDYDKVRRIYDWITSTITYDYTGNASGETLSHSAYAAVRRHCCVCQGYALLFYRMCLLSGIDARIVAGYGNGEKHGWNIVRIDGRYYYVDATWDAGKSPYSYFLTGSSHFDTSHRFDSSLNTSFHKNDYPIASEDYGPYWQSGRQYKYIYYDANGGAGAPAAQEMAVTDAAALSGTVPKKTAAVEYNATGGSCSNPLQKVDYIFKEWNTKEDGTGTAYQPGELYNASTGTTLYAQWTPGTLQTLPDTGRTGYTFLGWYSTKTGGKKYTAASQIPNDMRLYAHWKVNTYSVTFDANGGKNGPGKKTINYGTNLSSLTAPVMDYSTFQGWYTKKTGGTKVTTYNLTKDTTLYAHYSRTGIQNFVYRLYNTCLNRNPDPTGFEYWCTKLKNKTITGKSCAHGFVFSHEFTRRFTSNETFVEQLYKAMLGRGSDPTGKAYWLKKLKNGASREDIFNGFAASTEFNRICTSYGIKTN